VANILGAGGVNTLEIEANKAARVALFDANGNVISVVEKAAVPGAGQGGMPIMGKDKDTIRLARLNKLGHLESPLRRLLMDEPVEGTTLNSQRWTSTLTTMTVTQGVSGVLLNGSAITTINTGALITSKAAFVKYSRGQIYYRARMKLTLVANQVGEWGFAQMAALGSNTAQVTNGAFWRFTAAGTVLPVLSFNGSDVTTGVDISTSLSLGSGSTSYYDFAVVIDDDRITFICSSSATGIVISEQVIRLPLTQAVPFAVTHLNVWHRVYNTGSVPASAGQMFIADTALYGLELCHNLDQDRQLAENNQGASILPTTYAQAAQYANSAAPASATLSNTAAGYTTLGGFFQFAAQATNNTDFCLFGFTIPTPYRLKIHGIRVLMWNTGAANAATPATTLFFGLGLNGASVNLATGGHIRRAIGSCSIPISAAIGATSPDAEADFKSAPLICEPGTILAIIMRQIGGAATASQIIMGYIDVRGVFE
jgi:hypothetical protein